MADDINPEKIILSLDQDENEWWSKKIKEYRNNFVKQPKEYVKLITTAKNISKETLLKRIDQNIMDFREEVWSLYLIDEARFHKEVLSFLFQDRDLPRNILNDVLDKRLFDKDLSKLSKSEATKVISDIVGDYTGRVMPYIYQLSLSTTNSRRTRSGKVFETIIETFFDILDYPYDNQSSIKKQSLSLTGKKVDLIVPSAEAYLNNRSKSALITMKTSLRERWQEVAEELSRTNVPHIYLLTVDNGVTTNTIDIMKQYNITLVVYKAEKESKFGNFDNVKDFASFFIKEVPYIVGYWNKNDY